MALDILLVTMPWDTLYTPSIRLGILKAVLDEEGVSCEVMHFNLAAAEYMYAAPRAEGEPAIEVSDYMFVAERAREGLGEWVFAVPPYRDPPPVDDDPFLIRAKARYAPDERGRVAKLLRMRSLAPGFLERCLSEVLEAKPRVVGFSTTFSQTVASVALARLIRARAPETKIIFGGANCEGPMGLGLLRAFPEIDVVVRGEAERIIAPLCRDLLAGGPLERRPGLCFREGGAIVAVEMGASGPASMDDVPTPTYDDFFDRLSASPCREDLARTTALPLESSRGCWWGEKHHCTFCGLNGQTMAFRKKSARRVLDEMLALSSRHRVLNFQAVDNIFAMSYFRDLLGDVRDLGHDFRVFYETKANLTREQVRLFYEAGVRAIQPGIESFSTPILTLMDKGVTALQNIRLLKWCSEYRIDAGWSILYGFPGEPIEEYDRMASVVESLTHLQPPAGLARLGIDRFSPYHQRPREYGIAIAGAAEHYYQLYPGDRADVEAMAYHFDCHHLDGRSPESYVGRLRTIVDRWKLERRAGQRLVHRRGPGFLRIVDRRMNLPQKAYTLDDIEARIYLGCDAGATPASLARDIGDDAGVDADDIREFLDDLAEKRLVYAEGGRYLSLSTPLEPELRRAAIEASDEEPRGTAPKLVALRAGRSARAASA